MKTQCWIYGTIAFLALVACWSQNLMYAPLGLVEAVRSFLIDLYSTPASRSFSLDLGFLFLAVCLWMLQDSKKRGVPYVWAYIFFGLLIAISVTFPIYLIVREAYGLKKNTT